MVWYLRIKSFNGKIDVKSGVKQALDLLMIKLRFLYNLIIYEKYMGKNFQTGWCWQIYEKVCKITRMVCHMDGRNMYGLKNQFVDIWDL